MILQALKEYYDRKAADPDFGIEPFGWVWKEIPFLLVISEDGDFVRFEDTRQRVDGQLVSNKFLVPSLGETKGGGIKANLFWENPEYFFGVGIKSKEDLQKRHNKFVERILLLAESSRTIHAISKFLENMKLEELEKDQNWNEIAKPTSYILFAMNGTGAITNDPEIKTIVNNLSAPKITNGLCLVSGEKDSLATLEPSLRLLYGADKSGKLVSFNRDAFNSFNKTKGANSPIGKKASFAYTTALNTLLLRNSKQKLQLGDMTIVFWSAKRVLFEEVFRFFWGEPDQDENPDRYSEAIATLFKSVEIGAYATDSDDTCFYVLGLSPSAARIAVRFWYTGTIAKLATHIRTYFEDLRIIHGPTEKNDLPIRWLLRSLVRKPQDLREWDKKIPPNLAGETMRCILEGLPLPETLLQAALLRVKAERDVTYTRAKLIKGCLNRKLRLSNPNHERSLAMSLDKENTNVGYRLGRLFATLEHCQKKAQPGGKDMKTIRDRFYSSASSSPASVFANLMRLNKHHLAKLTVGWAHYFSNLIGEIVYHDKDKMGLNVFPAHLSLDDQGQFAIGYYHQTQDFRTKKTDKE